MSATTRPLLPVVLGLVLGAAWGTAPGGVPWHALLLVPLCAHRSTRWVGLAALAMLLRCAGTLEVHPAGPWDASTSRVSAGPSLRLEPQSVRDGEWIVPLGPGSPLLEARGPGAGGRCLRIAHGVDDVQRRSLPRGLDLPSPWGRWRDRALARLDRVADERTASLLGALLLGERRRLDPALVDGFTRTGTRHLLALSGLHVGLVAWLVAGPLARLCSAALGALGRGRVRLDPALPRAALVLALVPLAGGGPPVTRAALALALAAVASELRGARTPAGRRVDPLSLWALALLLELCLDPTGVRHVGVQLSYTATLGLLLATGPVTRRLRAALPGAGRLRAGLPALPRALGQRALDLGLSSLAASWVATWATAPLIWFHFGELAPAGILVTPLTLLPLVVLLALGWVAIALPALAPWPLLEGAAEALVALVRWADHLPGTPVVLPPRPAVLLAACAWLGLAACAGWGGRGLRRAVAAGLGALLLPWSLASKGLEVVMLDVGHGTCVLARAPGAGAWLFDAGSRDRPRVGPAAVAPVLRAWDVGRLTVVASHRHRDHVGALPWITSRWPVRAAAGALPEASDVERGRLVLPARGALRAALVRGSSTPGNEGSRSLELVWGATRLWLTGDAEQEGLAATLEAGDVTGPCAVLLLPHHGSDTPHLNALLRAAQPGEVWVSASEPPAVLEELSRRGLPWSCTALHGPQVRLYAFGMGGGSQITDGSRAEADD